MINLVDSSQNGNARRVAAGIIGRQSNRLTFRRVAIKRSTYTLQQLSDWRDSVYLNMLGKSFGVVFNDLDEVRNQVTVGISATAPASARGLVVAAARRWGIPEAALNIVTTNEPSFAVGARGPTIATRTMLDPGASLAGINSVMGGGY